MADTKVVNRDPYMDGSGGWPLPPELTYGLAFKDYGSYGLRQYGGWIREEFLPQLAGREAARVYREMLDNSSIVGSIMFTIIQSMRKVEWRCEPANDSAEAEKWAEFADGLRNDMSHTWDEFILEALSMLGFGYSVHEIVYKRRLGTNAPRRKQFPDTESKFDDGLIGWRRLPIRGQETVMRWFFDENGQIRGVTQQPWVGQLIDIPMEKLLLFRPIQHKNNPEGKSVLRNCYRSYYFVTRLEEQEAIMFERMSGFPVIYVPNVLLEAASSGNAVAKTALEQYKKIVRNVRIDEQMGAVLPSDTYRDMEGKPSPVRMFEFQLVTPQHGRTSVNANETIERHKVDMLMTLLCDFIKMGHEVRGTNNLAVTKVDMFYQAIEGWMTIVAEVLNRYALARLWDINGLDRNLMPRYQPDMPARLDLDSLGTFIKNASDAGMPLFPDDELQRYLRGIAGMPEETAEEALAAAKTLLDAETAKLKNPQQQKPGSSGKKAA